MDVTAGLRCDALAVLLQQPTVAADQRIICSTLQVCRAWSAEVQQSKGALTDIVVTEDSRQLAGACAWLAKYPGLVRTVTISKAPWRLGSYVLLQAPGLDAPIRTMLELSLQLAALGGCTRTVANSAGRAAAEWRLQSYQSDLVATAGMLAALPAATLTRLDIRESPVTDSFAGPLQRLTSLAELAIGPTWGYSLPSVGAAISAMRQLTFLSVRTADVACLQQLPVQLQQMAVHCHTGGIVKLGHLTNLTQLKLVTDDNIEPGSVLPAQLQQLTVACGDVDPVHVLGLSNLQRLQCLKVKGAITDPSQLASLASMPQLHELHLRKQHVHDNEAVFECAQMWSGLTMLCSLGVFESSEDSGDLIEICRLAASASSITSLDLDLEHLGEHHDGTVRLPLCRHLKGLTQLKELGMSLTSSDDNGRWGHCYLRKHDVLHLSAMTGLTRLVISAGGGVDDTAVCALATAFRHMQHLCLRAGPLTSASLPCLGLLTGLRYLALPPYSEEVVETGLKFLSSLTQLTYLQGFGPFRSDSRGLQFMHSGNTFAVINNNEL